MKKYDVIFIGSGHACWHGALLLKNAGKSVALVERELLGGTCTNYGCDAKILLDSPIELKEALERYKGFGLAQAAEVDWPELMKYKKAVIGGMPAALGGLFSNFGFDVIQGEASFTDAHTISAGGEEYSAEHFVIGTGADYIPMDVPGKEHMRNSRDFLSLDELPEHLSFIGGGIISMEFASICLALGKKVDILTHGPKVLKNYPQEYVLKIVEKMRARGANFVFGAKIDSVEEAGGKYIVRYNGGSSVESDYVLCALGRKANIEGLNLEALGIEASDKGIAVDDHMRTAVKHIYASGDVVDKAVPKLTPTAEFESNYIAFDILNPANAAIKYPAVPNLVFTLPRIAQVGVSLEDARKDAENYRVEEAPFGLTMAWLNKAERDAHMSFVFDKEGYLVGAAVMSDEAGEYIDMLSLIIEKRISAAELGSMIFSFPTPTYGLIGTLLPRMLKK